MTDTTNPEPELIQTFTKILRTYYPSDIGELAQHYPREQQSLAIDWRDIFKADPDLADDVISHPEITRESAEEALRTYDLPIDLSGWTPNIRFVNLPPDASRDIGHFRSVDASKRVTINGQITRKTVSRPRLDEAVFVCQRCAHKTIIPQSGEKLQEPYQCESCERQGPFELVPDECETSDHQKIRVQTPPERSTDGSTDSIDINLTGELVDTADVGQRVTLTSILRAAPESTDSPSRLLEWRMDGEHVEHEDTTFEDLDVKEHLERIREIANGTPFEDIVQSVNPSHLGADDVKLAIGLQLFGGVRKELQDGSIRRGDSHILLVGDPGCGKSKFLQWARKLSPRSIYTSGKASTAAGLTAAAVKDDFGEGSWTIEGGAMVKASEGIAAVDELDKMDDADRGAIMEALSEQTISVQKAGIEATLPARTRLLAAANPRDGRFDAYEPVAEQINLAPELVNRFDLIFTFTDVVEPEKDREIARHMNRAVKAADRGEEDEQVTPAIKPDVMRAYIAYARQNFDPALTDAADERLVEEYMKIRTANASDDDAPVPTNPRTLQAMQRLAEASARIRLSETVDVEDAERAVDIIDSYLQGVGIDPDTGQLDVDLVETGQPKSQRERKRRVEAFIREQTRKDVNVTVQDIAEAVDEDYGKVEHEVERLKKQGDVYEPESGKVRHASG